MIKSRRHTVALATILVASGVPAVQGCRPAGTACCSGFHHCQCMRTHGSRASLLIRKQYASHSHPSYNRKSDHRQRQQS